MKEIELKSDYQLAEERKNQFLASFDSMYEGDELPSQWDSKDRARALELTNSINTKKAIVTAIPMTCKAEKCSFKDTCPLFQEGIAPLGNPCPIEMGIVRNFMKEFVEVLDVDPDNLVEMLMIRDMVDQEVQMLRSIKILAQESFIQENVVGIDSTGDPIMGEQLHLAVHYQDKLHKRRQGFFKNFLATRQERLKSGLAGLDAASAVSTVLQSFHTVKRAQDEALKRELGIIDVDEYIEDDQKEEVEFEDFEDYKDEE